MTDNNIIEMSERCIRGNECDKCLYYELGRPDCMFAIMNCQKAEIKRLQKLVADNETIQEYEGLTPEQQLNLFRNKYYTDGSATERGIIANAINEILPLYYCQLKYIDNLNFDVETYRLRWAKATAKLDAAEAEIERLKEDNEALNDAIDSALDIVNGNYEIGRTAGIKEFVEKMKDYYNNHIGYGKPTAHTDVGHVFLVLDNLSEELVGEE